MNKQIRARVSGIAWAVAMTLATALPAQAQSFAQWLGGTGSWQDPTRWSDGVVPAYDTDVLIDGNPGDMGVAQITQGPLAFGSVAQSVVVGPQGAVTVLGNVLNVADNFSSSGVVTLARVPNRQSRISAGSFSLLAGGQTTLGGVAELQAGRVDVMAGHVLIGQGTVTTAWLNNGGLIDAQDGLLALRAPSSGNLTVVNQGVLRASQGGTLYVDGVIQNQLGRIELQGGALSARSPYGWAVQGGVIDAQGTGNSLNASLQDVTFQGTATTTGLEIAQKFTNQGVITVQAAPSSTEGALIYGRGFPGADAPVLIDGMGAIVAQDGVQARMGGVALGAGQTFIGSLAVADRFVNSGVMNIRGVQGLSLDSSHVVRNQGQISVAAGSRVSSRYGSGQINNTGSTMVFHDASSLDSVLMFGGALSSTGQAQLRGATWLKDVALYGLWQWLNDSSSPAAISGNLEVNGTLQVGAGDGRSTTLTIRDGVVLSGGGQTVLDGNAVLTAATLADAMLEVGVGHTLRGGGWITAGLYNQGVVQSDLSGQFRGLEWGGAYTVTNRGVMRAVNGTELRVTGDWRNEGGRIEAEAGARVANTTGVISGGQLIGGQDADAYMQAHTLDGVTLSGRWRAGSNAPNDVNGVLGLRGTNTNNGELTIGQGSTLTVRGQATLQGQGRLVLADGWVSGDASDNAQLIIEQGQVLTGQGGIAGLGLVNRGALLVEEGRNMSYSGTQPLFNESLIQVARGGILNVNQLVQRGVDSELWVDGNLMAEQLRIQQGRLLGRGQVLGNVSLEGGSLVLSGAVSLGIGGDLQADANSEIFFDLSSGMPFLNVSGDVLLGGQLTLNSLGFYREGDTFTLITAGAAGGMSGAFDRVVLLGTDLGVSLSYGARGLQVSVVPEPSAWAMGALGLAWLAARGRRQTFQRRARAGSGG